MIFRCILYGQENETASSSAINGIYIWNRIKKRCICLIILNIDEIDIYYAIIDMYNGIDIQEQCMDRLMGELYVSERKRAGPGERLRAHAKITWHFGSSIYHIQLCCKNSKYPDIPSFLRLAGCAPKYQFIVAYALKNVGLPDGHVSVEHSAGDHFKMIGDG